MLQRLLWIAAVLSLAGCAAGPAALGITGPGGRAPVPPPPTTEESGESAPVGTPQAGTYYGPSVGTMAPQPGFWGYNN